MNNNHIDKNIAHKYAKAFKAVFPKACSLSDINKIKIALTFLKKHKQTLLFLQLPQFDDERKKSMVADLVSHFALPHELAHIILLLIQHNRSFYIPEVLASIIELYKEQTNSMEFTLKSSHHLHEKQVEGIKQFLSKKLDKNIISTAVVDPSLIAGLRLQSNEYLWEYSVRKQIQELQQLEKQKAYYL
ncbi:MAG TPA: ATP synthase F1 subunit delta [Candidatus Babeliales bacterium]|nr:ATP synthase F1 subunit delta [Candidatus Babeliales bacterium]